MRSPSWRGLGRLFYLIASASLRLSLTPALSRGERENVLRRAAKLGLGYLWTYSPRLERTDGAVTKVSHAIPSPSGRGLG